MAYKNDSAEQEFQERVVTINRVSKTVIRSCGCWRR